MASQPAGPALQAVQGNYPFPLAFVLKAEVLDAATSHEQAKGLIHLANTALRCAALIAASNYAAAPFKERWSILTHLTTAKKLS